MSLSLSKLKASTGSTHSRKRVGRGNGSGHGTYSTRGLKGQKSRSGVSGLKRLGMKKQLLAVPKKRGFRSLAPKAQPVTLAELNKTFKDGAAINPQSLVTAGLAHTTKTKIKILAQGSLTLKNLKVSGVGLSEGARSQVEKAGGSVAA